MHLLIIEDDTDTAGFLADSLARQGHSADVCHDGSSGLHLARKNHYDAMIVDRMLPRLSGLDVVKQLKAEGQVIPTLFLSAMSDVNDRVDGLKAGADDYLVKPFAMAELFARLDAIARRHHHEPEASCLTVGDLVLNRLTRSVTRGGRSLPLRTREFELLEFLMSHAGQLVTRSMLLEQVWHYHFDPQTNVIDVHISRLRNKLDADGQPPLLHTLRGQGYSLHD
jgi:two-component system OmpR family response regulator